MQRALTIITISASVLLASCNFSFGSSSSSESSSSSSISSEEVTRNVSYEGNVQKNGDEEQGTHRLLLADGRFVLLEASDNALDLESYLNKNVEVRGSVSPSTDGESTFMRVEQVIVLDEMSSSSSEASSLSSLESSSSQASSLQTSLSSTPPASSSSNPPPAPPPSPVASSSSSAASVSEDALEADIVAMAKDNVTDPTRWTQKYCTSHIGFCIPVHKNWYFKSFGAANGSLWHVEFGLKAPETLLSGPIQLNLLAGTSAAAGGVSGESSTKGAKVIGYFDWGNGQHFEISADSRLAASVSYMVSHIEPYATPTP